MVNFLNSRSSARFTFCRLPTQTVAASTSERDHHADNDGSSLSHQRAGQVPVLPSTVYSVRLSGARSLQPTHRALRFHCRVGPFRKLAARIHHLRRPPMLPGAGRHVPSSLGQLISLPQKLQLATVTQLNFYVNNTQSGPKV